MPVINNSIELHDETTLSYFKLEQNIHGVYIYMKDDAFLEYNIEANLFISKGELGSFIKSLKNLESNY